MEIGACMNKKLTIAIPTYNRSGYLNDVLDSLSKELERSLHADCVSILVSDNASSDATPNIVEKFSRLNIEYYRNPTNIGADANFLECVRRSNSEYIWIFGDDDEICEGCIDRIIESMSDRNSALYISLDGDSEWNCKCYEFSSFHEFIVAIGANDPHFALAHSLITSNIFKKDIFDLDVGLSRKKTNYGHMYAMAARLKYGGRISIYNAPVMKTRRVRAEHPDPLNHLLIKQAQYLRYLGVAFRNPRIYMHSFVHLARGYYPGVRMRVLRLLGRNTLRAK